MRHCGVMVAVTSTARSMCHGEAGIRLQYHSAVCLPPLQPSPVSWTIKQHARVRARRAGDGSLERPLIIVCNAIPSTVDEPDARISANTTVADTIGYDTPSIGTDTIPIR